MRDEWPYHWPLLLVVAFCFCAFAILLSGCIIDDPRYNRGATPAPCSDDVRHIPTLKNPCKE